MRYLRLYGCFLRFSFSRAMEFRIDLYFRIVMDLVFYAVHLAFFTIIYQHTDQLGGWSRDQAYIFICGVFVVDALHMTILANNLWWLPHFINRGDLDYYLVRPVSSLFFLSLRDFAAGSFLNLIIASALLAWSLWRYPGELEPLRILLFLVFLLVGLLIYYTIRMLSILPTFWMHSNRGLDELSWAMLRLGERPHQIYHSWLRYSIVFLIPVALIYSFPAHTLFGDGSWWLLLQGLVTAGILMAALVLGWRKGLRSYSSASS